MQAPFVRWRPCPVLPGVQLINANNKLVGCIIAFSVLQLWDKHTMGCAGACHIAGSFQPLRGILSVVATLSVNCGLVQARASVLVLDMYLPSWRP